MYTRFKNTSGGTRYIGYLPGHGKTLANNEVIVLEGDLRSILASGENRYSRKAEMTALDYDIANGLCTIIDEDDGSSSS